MEGVIASALTGAMSSLLRKLATLLEKKYKLSRGAKKEIASLREEMSSMNALLLKLARAQQLDEQERDWRDKVRELSYDMEDCIDNFTDELDSGGGDGLLSALKKLRARYSVTVRIQELKARAVETSDRHDRYSCKLDETPQGLVAVDPRVQALHTEADNLVGMDGPKKKLIELLGTEEEAQRLKVIAVVGSGGMGKTTLANQVYAAMKSQFECRAFVSVSQNPNMVKVLSDIYYGIRGQMPCVMDDACRLIDEIKGHLQDKRYLIVIDDLWTKEAWNIIQCSFVENNEGSRVIITTRIEDVVRECCSSRHGHVYKIKPLTDLDSRRLFHRRIFYTEDACPDELKHVSDEILRKCGGMPLAILSMASILANHEEVNSKEIWEKVKNRLGLHLEGNYTVEWVRHVLNLGYNDLPVDLKTCMLYLGIFPEDAEISKDDLLKRWIAEGIVTEVHGDDPEVTAESYFCKLINRNMIQIAEFDDCGHIRSCRVHDLMLEFIILKSVEENFLTVINDLYRRLGSLAVRRLSIQVGNSECNLSLENMVLTQVRSLNFWGPVECMPSLWKFQLLRVLHIDACESEHDYDLSYTYTFFQLRYLRIGGIDCEKMLKQLRKSQQLHTLEIVDSNIMRGFRLDVRKLPLTLQHLIVPETVRLIGGISRLRALRTLCTLRLHYNDAENIEGLGELANLRELKLYCPSVVKGNTADSMFSCMSELGDRNLQSLTIMGAFSDEDVLTYWSAPPRHLRRLHMVDLRFSIVPDWILQLHMLLRSLEVQVVSLSRHGVEVLTGLTALVHLKLIVKNDVPEEGIILSGTSFMNLKEFSFRHNLPCLTFKAGTMPRLERLLIECEDPGAQQDDGAILTGIEHLGSLKVFKVDIYIYVNETIVSPLCRQPPKEKHVAAFRTTYSKQDVPTYYTPNGIVSSLCRQPPKRKAAFKTTYSKQDVPTHFTPSGINWMPANRLSESSLKTLIPLDDKHRERWSIAESFEAALRKAISRHPGSPNISIQIGLERTRTAL